jgi:hypothetical protein
VSTVLDMFFARLGGLGFSEQSAGYSINSLAVLSNCDQYERVIAKALQLPLSGPRWPTGPAWSAPLAAATAAGIQARKRTRRRRRRPISFDGLL